MQGFDEPNPVRRSLNLEVRLSYLEWKSSGEAVLLLHGLGHQARVWEGVAQVLAESHHVYALDHRGHGESGWDPKQRYSLTALVSDVGGVLDELGSTSLTLVGHSMSGAVAARAAVEHSDRVAGLVLVDTPITLTSSGLAQIRAGCAALSCSFASAEEYREALAHVHPLSEPERLDRLAEYDLRPNGSGGMETKTDPAFLAGRLGDGALSARVDPLSIGAWLPRLQVPTLVVRGAASSVVTPEGLDESVTALRDGASATIPLAGHAVMLDNPGALVRSILDHIATCSARSGGAQGTGWVS